MRGKFALAAAVAALLLPLTAGCGGGSSDAGAVTVGAVAVRTGSLSKDEFAEKADEICRSTRKEFDADYADFNAAHESSKSGSQGVFAKELVESVVLDDYGNEIEQIAALGAPQDYAGEIGSYLNALEQWLDEAQKDPLTKLLAVNTFKKPMDLAKKAGLRGCAESLS